MHFVWSTPPLGKYEMSFVISYSLESSYHRITPDSYLVHQVIIVLGIQRGSLRWILRTHALSLSASVKTSCMIGKNSVLSVYHRAANGEAPTQWRPPI